MRVGGRPAALTQQHKLGHGQKDDGGEQPRQQQRLEAAAPGVPQRQVNQEIEQKQPQADRYQQQAHGVAGARVGVTHGGDAGRRQQRAEDGMAQHILHARGQGGLFGQAGDLQQRQRQHTHHQAIPSKAADSGGRGLMGAHGAPR